MQCAAKQGFDSCAWQLARSEETAQAGPWEKGMRGWDGGGGGGHRVAGKGEGAASKLKSCNCDYTLDKIPST